MPEHVIAGVSVNFPFEPYDVQKEYMAKVITCLRDGSNAVLESPTGTGKTLSLLCSTLAWVLTRKQELQKQVQLNSKINQKKNNVSETTNNIDSGEMNEMISNPQWNMVPKVIYASRTHSQLTQAMQELKRTSYNFMRAVVLGSRDQLCIHPDVMREPQNSTKIQLCQLRVQTKTCSFHLRVESKKDHPDFRGPTIMDIEDLNKTGQKLRMCPYFGSKELVADADIIFMPYNYLLDPKARKANKIELKNTVIILDEAHNIEKICEESASVQIRSSDVAMAIDDTTQIMQTLNATQAQDFGDEPKEFNLEDLALLKEMLLDLEKTIDEIVVENTTDGTTFPATFIFELLGNANFNYSTAGTAVSLMEKLVQYLAIASQNSGMRKGVSFQKMSDLLTLVFINKAEAMDKVTRSFKVHVQIEEPQPVKKTHNTGWLSKVANIIPKPGKIINYWCFNPGFGMEQLLNQNIRSVILTSGTLAPLKPLIAELAIPVAHHLENPHIVNRNQVYVKIIGSGPDKEVLISNYTNRDNPKYISSLGQTILNVSRIVPDGLLVFFPSYPMLNQCVNAWQASGLWSTISIIKPIFVEPRSKDSFTSTMEEYYQSIRDSKGACFMAVCRGKVSEGLDFADRNGRAVIITGLPFPPMKDPKVILKRKYLEENRTKENELLTGNAWYSLDATRAVNQAIGRVIRHRNDYGAILLCDARFQQPAQVQQLSKWIRLHLGNTPQNSNFGPIVREIRQFFRDAEKTIPQPNQRSIEPIKGHTNSEITDLVRSELFVKKSQEQPQSKLTLKVNKTYSVEDWTPLDYVKSAGQDSDNVTAPKALDFMSRLNTHANVIDYNVINHDACTNKPGQVKIHKRIRPNFDMSSLKEKRFKLENLSPLQSSSSSMVNSNEYNSNTGTQKLAPQERVEFLRILRSSLSTTEFDDFKAGLIAYKDKNSFDELMVVLQRILGTPELRYMLLGMRRFMKTEHKSKFDELVLSQH